MFYMFNQNESGVFKYSHPLKVPYMKDLCSRFGKIHELDYVLLFGSTLTEYCDEYSDIDLYLILNCVPTHCLTKQIRKSCRIKKQSIDMLFNTMQGFMEEAADISSVEYKIAREGVVLYAKSNAV